MNYLKDLTNYIIDLCVGIIHAPGIIFLGLLPYAKEATTNKSVLAYGYNNLVENIGVLPSFIALIIMVIAIAAIGKMFRQLYKVEDIINDRQNI